MTSACETGSARLTLYGLLIAAAAGIAGARIASAELLYEPSLHRDKTEPRAGKRLWPELRPTEMPTFSSNDRSRWATVRSLVEEGTFVIGRRAPGESGGTNQYGDRGIVFEDGYKTVDKVLDPQTSNFYSSKPPLLSVVAAGEYWLLHRLFGWSIVEDRWLVVGAILFTLNWLPFLVYLWALSKLIERYGHSEWGRLLVMAAACFGTMITPFLITFNNHTLATCSALFALFPALLLWDSWRLKADAETGRHGEGGNDDANAPTEVVEDADSTSPRPAASATCPCGPIPLFLASGFFAGLTAALELPAAGFAAALFLLLAYREPLKTLLFFVPAGLIPVAAFLMTNYMAVGLWTPIYAKFGTEWYEYEGSHWRQEPGQKKAGIDFLEEPKPLYAFNLLLGHHGLFSLTPVFFLSLAGLLFGMRRANGTADNRAPPARPVPAQFIILTLFLLVLIVGFYIYKSNNYGGWSSGPRWLMWLTPLLLLAALPVADKLSQCRWGRSFGYVCLALSVFSATYPTNPWRHPWIHVFVSWQGWIDY